MRWRLSIASVCADDSGRTTQCLGKFETDGPHPRRHAKAFSIRSGPQFLELLWFHLNTDLWRLLHALQFSRLHGVAR